MSKNARISQKAHFNLSSSGQGAQKANTKGNRQYHTSS